jgi:hypothetical protein
MDRPPPCGTHYPRLTPTSWGPSGVQTTSSPLGLSPTLWVTYAPPAPHLGGSAWRKNFLKSSWTDIHLVDNTLIACPPPRGGLRAVILTEVLKNQHFFNGLLPIASNNHFPSHSCGEILLYHHIPVELGIYRLCGPSFRLERARADVAAMTHTAMHTARCLACLHEMHSHCWCLECESKMNWLVDAARGTRTRTVCNFVRA